MKELPAPAAAPQAGYNLLGQRLGRKGQETRERILVTALRLIETCQDTPLTLSAVAREASVGMTTLYLYFPNLGDLVLAALTRVMDGADEAFIDRLRTHWPDGALLACAKGFLHAHYQFWRKHARILYLRNSFEDAGDARFLKYRNNVSRAPIELLIQQMDGRPDPLNAPVANCAIVLVTAYERLAALTTNPIFHTNLKDLGVGGVLAYIDGLIDAEAELMALVVRHQRKKNHGPGRQRVGAD
jgi:AcrR family transcriptional regulator